MTDGVLDELTEWLSRPLDSVFPVVFVDALMVKVRDGVVANRPVYVAIGTDCDGAKQVLGMWVGASTGESAKFWMNVLSELRNRGVKDVCILCCDGPGRSTDTPPSVGRTDRRTHRSLPISHDHMVVLVLRCVGSRSFEGRDVTEDDLAPRPMIENDIAWYDVQKWGVEGKGWSDTARFYDRLPARAEASVRREVWDLSRCSAGMLTRFATDSTAIHARYTLRSSTLALPHMPASSVSGIDLYAQGSDGRDRWLAGSAPTGQFVEARLVADVEPGMRRYTAYLPLYNEVDSLQIGVEPTASFVSTRPRPDKPLLFYGSSIVQGACATRPGSTFTAILGRYLDKPVVNLGFSGNALMEPEVGALVAELDPAVFVLDCLPNMRPNEIAQRSAPLIRQIRAARPDTPILMVEDRTQTHAWLVEGTRARHRDGRTAYRDTYRRLLSSGMRNLTYLEGARLLPDDGEGTVDGSHPNDVGMASYAAVYAEVLEGLLEP